MIFDFFEKWERERERKLEYDIQKEFEHARKCLRYHVGLELCLAEQIILRNIVDDVTKNLREIEFGRNKYRPAIEAAVRFLFQEYGVTHQSPELYKPITGGYYSEDAAFVLNYLQSKTYVL